jgi:hypothetical protein
MIARRGLERGGRRMKEIIVTKPDDCPFRHYECACHTCELNDKICNGNNFPPDCPLFENDYLIKRRSE